MFITGQFPFRYGNFCLWPPSASLHDINSQFGTRWEVSLTSHRDMTGWLPGRWSHGRYQESLRIGEISNMFDILLIHRNKPGNYK